MAKDEWVGIPLGYAYQGITYDKGAPIWFVGINKKELDHFIEEFFHYQSRYSGEREWIGKQSTFEGHSGVHTVYPYDRIGGIEEKLPNGTIIFSVEVPTDEKGHWEKDYIRVSPSRIKRMPDYVF